MTPLVPNPMNQLARVGIGLLAIYWGVRGLADAAVGVGDISRVIARLDRHDAIEVFAQLAAAQLAIALVFSVLPAVLVYRGRRRLAEHLAPINEDATPLTISPDLMRRISALLLAIWFGVGGLIGLVSSIAAAAMAYFAVTGESATGLWIAIARTLPMGVIYGIAAILLWRYSASAPASP